MLVGLHPNATQLVVPDRTPAFQGVSGPKPLFEAPKGDDGNLADLRLFVNQGGEGVATDSAGNVYLAAGEVYVYDQTGALIETLAVPNRPTQVVFGGSDRRTLFLPARDALFAVRTRLPGR